MIRFMPFFKILAWACLYSLINDGDGVKVQINHKCFMITGRIMILYGMKLSYSLRISLQDL